MALIDQKSNYAADFGEVLRSSAIFYARNDAVMSTTISFMNYWRTKSNLDVAVIANVRAMSGELLSRQRLTFESGEVVNFSPPNPFEGSVEIEVLSLANLRIPYAAVVGIYESDESVAIVHSYARAYSQHEIEEGRTLSIGEESCWTVRLDSGQASFAVIHNGPDAVPSQTATLRVRREDGEERTSAFEISALRPYETFILHPEQHLDGLDAWLGGEPGNARVSFELGNGFTRFLCCWHDTDWREFQVTHSNFDYSTHETDLLEGESLLAYMKVPPAVHGRTYEAVVYPDFQPGEYVVERNSEGEKPVRKIHRIPVEAGDTLAFRRVGGELPSRLVTGLRLNHPTSAAGALDSECSLGVIHPYRPGKSSHWMPVSARLDTSIHVTAYEEIYGPFTESHELTLTLYSQHSSEGQTLQLSGAQVLQAGGALELSAMYPEADEFLGRDFGYLSISSEHKGLLLFTGVRKGNSIALEHSF